MVVNFRRRLTHNQGIGVLSTMSAMAIAFLVMIWLPPWTSTIKGALVLAIVLTGVAVVVWMRPGLSWSQKRLPPSGIHLAPRAWLTALTFPIALLGYAATGVLGTAVVPTWFLPERPSEAVATSVYRECPSRGCARRVEFVADGQRVDAVYARAYYPGDADRVFVYDPARPTHVMPRAGFRFGRGSGRIAFGAIALVTMAWCAGAFVSSRRRRLKALTTLGSQPIVASEPAPPDRRLLIFADGSRHTFLQTPELEELLRGRMP